MGSPFKNNFTLCSYNLEKLQLQGFCFVLFCFVFGGSQVRGLSSQSYSCRPQPQPQPHQIWAVSVTYATAHGNARSLTQWARPGMEPATSWFLVRFVSPAPWRELQVFFFFFFLNIQRLLNPMNPSKTWNLCIHLKISLFLAWGLGGMQVSFSNGIMTYKAVWTGNSCSFVPGHK